jgi:oligoendopeptidase F
MGRYLELTDRAVRDAAWRAIAQRRLNDREALNGLYDRMISSRDRMAHNAGFENYIGYAFVEKKRFDYTPRDCAAFWSAVEKHVVPLVRRLDRERQRALGVESLRPWDLAVDTRGRPALHPFEGGQDLLRKAVRTFHELDPRLGKMISDLAAPSRNGAAAQERDEAVRTECLDLDSRKGKRPGGYQYVRDRRRRPFIFMNAAGLQRDVMTMIHEAGHAFHSMLCAGDPLLEYRHSPIEFAEVASMSMEHLTMPYWGEAGFYTTDEDLARARRTHLEDSITILAWIATIDAFQHWVYSHPAHSRDERDGQWLALDARFGHAISWEGLDDFRAAAWQKQSHLFTHPMYYIEYGIAQLGALQLWLKSGEEGEPAAVNAYIRALTLGGSRPLPDLFAAAGLEFDFGDATIARIVEAVEGELERIGT